MTNEQLKSLPEEVELYFLINNDGSLIYNRSNLESAVSNLTHEEKEKIVVLFKSRAETVFLTHNLVYGKSGDFSLVDKETHFPERVIYYKRIK